MRVPLRFTLAIYAILVPLILVLVCAEQMPAIVARFEETRDLWRKLYHGSTRDGHRIECDRGAFGSLVGFLEDVRKRHRDEE